MMMMMMVMMMILFLIRMLLFCPLSSSSSPQGIPRTLALDSKTGVNLIQWPIEEVNALRMGQVSKTDVKLDAGAVVQVEGAVGGQVRERERERESTHKVLQIAELLSSYAASW
jgi:beta-fructofuranosidase